MKLKAVLCILLTALLLCSCAPVTTPASTTTQPTTKPTTKPSGSGNKPSQDGSNAKTGDEVMLFVMLMVFSLMGIGAATVLRKKEEI